MPRKHRRRKRPKIFLPMASMGDIAFLLIIFFMLASTFMKSSNMQLEEARSAELDKQEAPMVTVVLDEAGTLWLQGQPCGVAELSGAVQALVGDHRDRPVHVRIDRRQPRRVYMPVIEALSEAGVKLVLAGQKEEPEP